MALDATGQCKRVSGGKVLPGLTGQNPARAGSTDKAGADEAGEPEEGKIQTMKEVPTTSNYITRPAPKKVKEAPTEAGGLSRSSVEIDKIKIDCRARQDLGDLNSLVASIERVGLLHPVVLTEDGRLISGARRIAAFKILGRDEIPYTVASSLKEAVDLLQAERDENVERKPLSPTEAVALAMRLEPLEREAASKRMRTGKPSENFSKGRASDKVAAAVGMSRPTLAKAIAVVEAAEAEPEKFGPLVAEMAQTGKVAKAHRRMRNIKENLETIPEVVTVPSNASTPGRSRSMKLTTHDFAMTLERIDVAKKAIGFLSRSKKLSVIAPDAVRTLSEMHERLKQVRADIHYIYVTQDEAAEEVVPEAVN